MSRDDRGLPSPTPPPPSDKPPMSRARKWRRRLSLVVVVLLAMSLVSRLVLIFILPPVLRHVAHGYGLTAQYEHMELYLLDGDVGIWHFSLSPIEGGDPLVQSEYARCDVSVLDLLRGRLSLRRLEAEGIDVLIERKSDGTIPLLQRIAANLSAQTTTAAAPASSTTPQEIDLTSPLKIDAFRLTSVRARIRDSAVTPKLDTMVELNIRLTDLDSHTRPTHFEMNLLAQPVLDLMHVEGTATASGKVLVGDLHVEAQGFHPLPAAGYLIPLGIQPTARTISLRMNAQVKTSPTTQPDAVAATLNLSDIAAIADGQEAAALDKVNVSADAVNFTTAQIANVLVEGARCQVRRDQRGLFGVAGFDLVASAPSQPSSSTSLGVPFVPLHWSLGKLEFRDWIASFHDQAIVPAADVSFRLDDLTVSDISPKHAQSASPIHGRFTAPGIISKINLDGEVKPFAAEKTLDLNLQADGIRPDALRPYLDAMGLESDYVDGKFTAAFHADATPSADGHLSANANISKLTLSDSANLFAMDGINISGAAYDPAANRWSVKSIDIAGPQLVGQRDASGAFAILGLHTKQKPPAARSTPVAAAATAPTTQTNFAALLPKLEIDRFTWKGVRLQFDDQAVTPNSSLCISDAGVELTKLNIDLDPKDKLSPPGKIRAWLIAPNLVQNVSAIGSLNPGSGGLAMDLAVDGKGITAEKIEQYFRTARIQPIVQDGTFHFTTHLAVTRSADNLGAALAVKDVIYKDGPTELLAVDSAAIDGLSSSHDGLKIDRVSIKTPRISATREADGSILALGVRIRSSSEVRAPDRLYVVDQSSSNAENDASSASAAFTAMLGDFNLDHASLHWSDRAVSPPASAHFTADVDLQNAVIGRSAPPAKLSVTVHEDKALDRLTITGLVTPSLNAPTAQLDIDAAGIRAGDLGSYAAPNKVNLQDGHFHVAIDGGMNPNPAGGVSGHLLVSALDFRDGSSELCKIDSIRLGASRIDPLGRVVAIDEISLSGLEASATRSKDGTIHLLGLALGEAPAAPLPAPAAPAIAPAPVDAKAVTAGSLAALTQKKYPLVSVQKFAVNVRRISLTDESRPDATPLAISNLQISNSNRIKLLGDDPHAGPPVDLQISGAIDPLVKTLDVRASLTPFAEQPRATFDVNLSGIRGDGVTDLFPSLKSQLDGSAMTDGRFAAHLSLLLRREIHDPLDFDLSGGFGLDVSAKGIEFRDRPDGPVLAGLEEATSENIRVQPEAHTVVVQDIELTNPSAKIFRDSAGVHVLGWVAKLSPTPASTTQVSSNSSLASSATPAPAVAPVKPVGEIAINKFIVSGLDFNFEDRTCDPPLIVPLSGLDMEVRDLSSRMPYEDKPCRFNILLNSGNMQPLADAGSSATTKKSEPRELFSQVEVSGVVSLYPQPKGWVKTSISALDLSALGGEANQAGIDLTGGTFDASADLRLIGDGNIDARSHLTLTDLKIQEPPNGPIVRILKIDAPLSVVIAALQDQDGSINIPIQVPIKSGHVSGGDLTVAAAGAVASVVVSAVAAAPLKAADAPLAILGVGKNKKKDEPVTLKFDSADRALSLENILQLHALLVQMNNDDTLVLTLRHELGGGDVSRAAVLANPSPEDCRNLAYRLHLNKIDLLTARQAAAQQVRAQLASNFGADANESIRHLNEIDRALAANEDALDNVYNMLRPGADRQSARRTRAACLQIAQDRLDAVYTALARSGIPDIDKRINVGHATFNPADGDGGGSVTIVLTHKKPE
jgi:hypothetical protein